MLQSLCTNTNNIRIGSVQLVFTRKLYVIN